MKTKVLPYPLIKKKVPGLLVGVTGQKPYNKHQQPTPHGEAHTTSQPHRATPKPSNDHKQATTRPTYHNSEPKTRQPRISSTIKKKQKLSLRC